MSDPDLIVVQGTGTLFDGRWIDRRDLVIWRDPREGELERAWDEAHFENLVRDGYAVQFTLVPVGEFEISREGRVAEVWRPKAVA